MVRSTGFKSALSAVAMLLCSLAASAPAAAQTGLPQTGQDLPPSQCLAVAQAPQDTNPVIRFARLDGPATLPLIRAQAARPAEAVTLTYITHSTWRIDSPEGVSVATDYAGWAGPQPPTIATMNKAHSSHWTANPDPAIIHVLPGWNPEGSGPVEHRVVEGDVYVRNVTTDIRNGDFMEADGNSIFIIEVAGLCIAHLGHLHHGLEDRHYSAIGRMDVVMVPVDGGLTLSHTGMAELMERLQPSVILPMHLRGRRIDQFIARLGETFAADFLPGNTLEVSLRTLPRRPTVFIPVGLN